MKMVLALALALILTGCAARFSDTNYNSMVNLVTITRDSGEACSSKENMIKTYESANAEGIHILEHSAGRKDPDITKMITDLNTEIANFGKQLASGKISVFYCKSKMDNINHGARIMLHEEGEKPRI